MKKTKTKLQLQKVTVRILQMETLVRVVGGGQPTEYETNCSSSCNICPGDPTFACESAKC
jgi:hypothetical protein